MSSFMRVNGFTQAIWLVAHSGPSPRHHARWGPWNWHLRGRERASQWADGMLWPRSRLMGGDQQGTPMFLSQDAACTGRYEAMPEEGGHQGMLAIRGTCYASDGTTPVSGATVQIFVTATDEYLRDTVSAVDGAYEARTQRPAGTTHYLVAYKAGSPDIAGTTVNTLVGS